MVVVYPLGYGLLDSSSMVEVNTQGRIYMVGRAYMRGKGGS